ncbi:MAG: hypothetical protein NTX28_05350, partial [Novosphingobium sp.]|nr:hypothetical protein [Novosphingobium sp.]
DKELVFAASPQRPLAGAITLTGPVSATAFRAATLSTFTSGTISVAPSATGSGLLQINATGTLTATNLTAAKDLTLNSATSIQTGSVTSQTGATTFTAPTITTGAVQAGTEISLSGQTLITADLTAATAISLDASGAISTANLVAGTGAPSATGLGTVAISSGANVSTGTITASGDLGIAAVGTISAGQATGYDMLLLGGSTLTSGGLTANRVLIGDVSLAPLGQTANGYDKDLVFAASPQRPLAGAIALTGPVSATEFRAATLSTFTSGAIGVAPSVTGSGLLQINASGALTATNLSAAKDLTLNSTTSIQTGSVTSQTGSTTFTAPTITTSAVQAGTAVSLTGQTITTGNLSATAQGGSVIGRASQAMSAGAIASGGLISIIGTDQVDVQSATSTGGPIDLAAGNVLNVGTVNGARAVTLVAGTAAATGGLVAGQGRIAAGSVQGAGLVQIAAGGQVGTGNVRSTGDNVKIASFGSTVTTGAISAARDALVSGAQGVTIGANINARDVILLSGANVSSAGILAGAVFAQSPTSPSGFTLTNATGRVLIANASMASGSLLLSTASDFSSLFLAPVSLPGSVNVTGQVAAAQFRAFSVGNMTGAGIAAFNNIEVESGGLVTVGQRWGAPNIEIASVDIRIIDNGALTGPNGPILSGLRTSATGEIDLISVSSSPALIGDGLSGSGYALSAAEIGLISTHQLLIGAIDVAANPVDMLIGNLALSAGGTNGSTTIGDATGSINFITGNRQTSVAGGGIRVVGNVTGTGFASGNIVEFNTGRFEIDAGTGSVALAQGANTLGGTIEIHAANIHVASAAILDKLAADPFYVGRVAELNAPAAVQRPEGVLRALGLDLYPTGTLYIQNTGTALDPAGFLADIDLANVNPAPNAAPASISIIVNGKWQTTAGIVSGFAARDLVVQTSDVLSFFAPESTINGCAISASSCVPETMIDPVPAIASQIQIISNNPLGSTPTLVATQEAASQPGEASQDEPYCEAQTPEEAAREADDATSPIAPPPQIIDSSPLEPQQQIEQPVAGSGNPSLIGSVVNENSAEGDAQ